MDNDKLAVATWCCSALELGLGEGKVGCCVEGSLLRVPWWLNMGVPAVWLLSVAEVSCSWRTDPPPFHLNHGCKGLATDTLTVVALMN